MYTVYFHKLDIVKDKIDPLTGLLDGVIKSRNSTIKSILLNQFVDTPIQLQSKPSYVMLDVLSVGKYDGSEVDELSESDYVFCRIGKRKDLKDMTTRNLLDLSTSDIRIDPHKEFEIFTYFLISLDSSIITFLNSAAAPAVNYLTNLPTNFGDGKRIVLNFIADRNAMAQLKKKKIINEIEITFAVPGNSVLASDLFNLNESAYESFKAGTEFTVTLKAKAKVHHSVFKSQKAQRFLNWAKDSNGFNTKAKAKNKVRERMVPISIESEKFAIKAEMDYQNLEDAKQKLVKIYLDNAEELKRMSR